MYKKFLPPLTARDKADCKAVTAYLPVGVTNRPGFEQLVASMSDRIRPAKPVRWCPDGWPDSRRLTEELKGAVRIAVRKAEVNAVKVVKPVKTIQRSVAPKTAAQLKIDKINAYVATLTDEEVGQYLFDRLESLGLDGGAQLKLLNKWNIASPGNDLTEPVVEPVKSNLELLSDMARLPAAEREDWYRSNKHLLTD